jgi:hypothetical protein
MFFVQVWARCQGDKEPVHVGQVESRLREALRATILTAVCVFASICHTYQALFINLPPSDILVFELSTIYRGAACSIALCDVAALDHEFVDDSVERGHFVGEGKMRAGAYCLKTIATVSTSILEDTIRLTSRRSSGPCLQRARLRDVR